MITKLQNVAPFYEGWRFTNDRLIQRIAKLSAEELGLRAAPNLWPIWAIAAHAAGMRVYWLCSVFKERGAEHTPFPDANGEGWEDDLGRPRRSGGTGLGARINLDDRRGLSQSMDAGDAP